VSAKPNVFRLLPEFRNFFAHRNRYTMRSASLAASGLGLPSTDGPAAALVFRPPTKAATTLAEWLIDLEEAVQDLCS
jgi:hypothetical protein